MLLLHAVIYTLLFPGLTVAWRVCSDLVVKVQEHLAHAGFKQHPCLGCSKQNAKLAFAV